MVCFLLILVSLLELFGAAGGEIHLQLVMHIPGLGDAVCDFADEAFFLFRIDSATQGDLAINSDDLHVFCIQRHLFSGKDLFSNPGRRADVGLAVALVQGS